ncbi:putative nonspecific lipid-transfer protein, mitochondrial precursor [Ascobolus immersus RN42]|uniref:propanoyl-CoA C-acyltransferase n=1 Tax=Ascobolus immersus RN42 TaxID=1160509 RepID=A0A3N4HW20_ASCIM|nr:putative nonspecific lipid-transfer protein, mitochondrial precursor [Ascobolus immersus RN42]
MASNNVYVVGVGMTKFIKPRGQVDYPEMGFEAGVKALLDAGLNYDDVDQGVACYCYGDSTCGQRVFYQLGLTGIPIYNVNNNCATGSSGLHMARTFLQSGTSHCALIIGFEKMSSGSLKSNFSDREAPLTKMAKMMYTTRGIDPKAPSAAQFFGNAGREYIEKYGASKADFAEIARVNHEHSQRNPYSQFRDVYTLDQIMASPSVYDPLTKLQCCPTSDGAAAAVLVSQHFLDTHPELKQNAVLIAGQAMTTDSPDVFNRSAISLIGFEMSQSAAQKALAQANLTPADISVVELHDCFSANEMVTIEALGLCGPGEAYKLVRNGDITYGGKYVINPSGGLISKGHPLGATGLAQCAELVWHVRGWANNRLVPGTKAALQHNLGLGGTAVVTVYRRPDGEVAEKVSDEEVARRSGCGYNPAVEARGISEEDKRKVCSRSKSSRWMEKDELKVKSNI